MSGVFIAATGYHHPERRVGNEELVRRLDTTDQWILDHTGIVERRYAPEDVNTSDLGEISTRQALKRSGWDPRDVELLACATSTPDALTPATAPLICKKIGLSSVAFDVNAGCSGFVYALAVVEGLVKTRAYGRAAVCAADKLTRVIDHGDRKNCIFFGDSAATVMLQADPPPLGLEVVDIVLANQNEGAEVAHIPIEGYFEMDGPGVKDFATRGFVDNTDRILARNGVTPDDLRALVGHQANLRLLEELADSYGINDERHWHNVEMYGNQGASGAATTLCAGIERHADDLKDGDLLLVTVVGGGFTGGSVLLRRIDRRSVSADRKAAHSEGVSA